MLVAFAVLSLGLGLAVQNVSQASLSLRKAREQNEDARLLHRVMSEEVPRMTAGFSGTRVTASGEGWELALARLVPGEAASPLRVEIRVKPKQARAATLFTTIVAPAASMQQAGDGL